MGLKCWFWCVGLCLVVILFLCDGLNSRRGRLGAGAVGTEETNTMKDDLFSWHQHFANLLES